MSYRIPSSSSNIGSSSSSKSSKSKGEQVNLAFRLAYDFDNQSLEGYEKFMENLRSLLPWKDSLFKGKTLSPGWDVNVHTTLDYYEIDFVTKKNDTEEKKVKDTGKGKEKVKEKVKDTGKGKVTRKYYLFGTDEDENENKDVLLTLRFRMDNVYLFSFSGKAMESQFCDLAGWCEDGDTLNFSDDKEPAYKNLGLPCDYGAMVTYNGKKDFCSVGPQALFNAVQRLSKLSLGDIKALKIDMKDAISPIIKAIMCLCFTLSESLRFKSILKIIQNSYDYVSGGSVMISATMLEKVNNWSSLSKLIWLYEYRSDPDLRKLFVEAYSEKSDARVQVGDEILTDKERSDARVQVGDEILTYKEALEELSGIVLIPRGTIDYNKVQKAIKAIKESKKRDDAQNKKDEEKRKKAEDKLKKSKKTN